MTFLSPPALTADTRLPGSPLPVVLGLVLAVLRVGAAGSYWVLASLLMVLVIVTWAGCGSCSLGVMVTRLVAGGAASGSLGFALCSHY